MATIDHRGVTRGKMLWFNEDKNQGVIATEQAERLPVHGSAFDGEPPQGPCSGLLVEFELEANEGEPRAARVRLVPEVVGRRARRRRSR
jgi:cold shock CspA family protein